VSVGDRLGRLLFIVPYVVHRNGVPLAELAQLLGVSVGQIESDISLLSMVGQPPLTPDHLIDLNIDNGVVYVALDQNLVRPLQLTHEEARALAIGASLVGDLAGLGHALEAVLTRLTAQLNPVDREAVLALKKRILVHGSDVTGHAARLRASVEAHQKVRLTYYSASSDQEKQYLLKPLGLFTHSGDEYLVGLDTAALDQEKLFRLDRMGDVQADGGAFVPPSHFDLEKFRTSKLYFGTDNLHAIVHFTPALAAQVRQRFTPDDIVGEDATGLQVHVATASAAWLSRWVLSFGEGACVLSPAVYRNHLRAVCCEAHALYAQTPVNFPPSS
jgi:predicted DNA-binding transcriptional regulator YafY